MVRVNLLGFVLALCCALSAAADEPAWAYLRTGISSKSGLNGATWSTNGAKSGDLDPADLGQYNGMIRNKVEGQTLAGGEEFVCPVLQVGQLGTSETDAGSLRFYDTLTVRQLILANGTLKNTYATLYAVNGPVSVISPNTLPFRLTNHDRPNGGFVFNGPISSLDADVALLVCGTTNDYTAVFAGDASDFTGLVRVESELNPGTGVPFGSTFKINAGLSYGGSVAVGAGATFEALAGVSVAGDVSLASGAAFDFAGAVSVGSLTLEEGVGLAFAEGAQLTVTDDFSYSGVIPLSVSGAPTTPPDDVMTRPLIDLPIAATVTPADFSLPPSDAPNLTGYLSFVTNNEQTVKTLSVSYYPVVTLDVKDSSNWSTGNQSSAVDNEAAWSDKAVPHGRAHYAVSAKHLVLPSDPGAFAGTTLTLTGSSAGMTVQSPDYRIDRLITESTASLPTKGVRIQVKQGATDLQLSGALEIRVGTLDVVGRAGSVLTLASAISGDETANCRFSGATGATSAFKSSVVLSGDNTAFKGVFELMANPYFWPNSKPGVDTQFTTLRISSREALGGPLAAPNYRALTIGEGSLLQADASVTLDTANRGIFLSGPGTKEYVDGNEEPILGLKSARFSVPDAAHTLTILEPITVTNYAGGVIVTKEGAGTLALGGALGYLSVEGLVRDGPATGISYELTVTDGSIEVLSDEALNGFDIVFAPAKNKTVGLRVPAKTTGNGLVNVNAGTPFAKADGLASVPVPIDEPAEDLGPSATVPLFTVPAAADVSFFALPSRLTLAGRE